MKLFLILLLILIVTQTQDYSCWYSGHACYNNVVSCKNEAKCVQAFYGCLNRCAHNDYNCWAVCVSSYSSPNANACIACAASNNCLLPPLFPNSDSKNMAQKKKIQLPFTFDWKQICMFIVQNRQNLDRSQVLEINRRLEAAINSMISFDASMQNIGKAGQISSFLQVYQSFLLESTIKVLSKFPKSLIKLEMTQGKSSQVKKLLSSL